MVRESFVMGGNITIFATLQTLVIAVAGGILCGVLVAGGVLLLAGRTDDDPVKSALSAVAAYGSFLLAEHFHLSGVLASLVAGLLTGNIGSLGSITDRGRDVVLSFWEFVVFVFNSIVFALIGLRGAHQDFSNLLFPIVITITLMFAGRALAIYPLSSLFSRSTLRVSMNQKHFLFWGGLRGALVLTFALGLPPELPERDAILTVAFAVVACPFLYKAFRWYHFYGNLKRFHDKAGSKSSP